MRFTLVSLFALSAFTFVAASPSGISSDTTIRSALDEAGSTQLDLDSTATSAIVSILTNASAMIAPLADQLSFAQQGDSPVESIAPIISNIKDVLSGTVSQLESLPFTTISERDLGLGEIIKALTSLLDLILNLLDVLLSLVFAVIGTALVPLLSELLGVITKLLGTLDGLGLGGLGGLLGSVLGLVTGLVALLLKLLGSL